MKHIRKNIKRCALSNKIVSDSKEVILVEFAVEYVKKLGYRVIPESYAQTIQTLTIVFLCFGALLMATSFTSAERGNFGYNNLEFKPQNWTTNLNLNETINYYTTNITNITNIEYTTINLTNYTTIELTENYYNFDIYNETYDKWAYNHTQIIYSNPSDSWLSTYNATYDSLNSSILTFVNNNYALLNGDNVFSGRQDFNGGWTSNGVSIIDGDVFAQTGYFYNITGLNVNNLNVVGDIIPSFDNSFKIGNSTRRYQQGYFNYLNGNQLDISGSAGAKNIIGFQAQNTADFYGLAIGRQANVSSRGGIAIGYLTKIYNNQYGLALGSQAMVSGGASNVAIGLRANNSANYGVCINSGTSYGNCNVASVTAIMGGNVGIKTANPLYDLHVNGGLGTTDLTTSTFSSSGSNIDFYVEGTKATKMMNIDANDVEIYGNLNVSGTINYQKPQEKQLISSPVWTFGSTTLPLYEGQQTYLPMDSVAGQGRGIIALYDGSLSGMSLFYDISKIGTGAEYINATLFVNNVAIYGENIPIASPTVASNHSFVLPEGVYNFSSGDIIKLGFIGKGGSSGFNYNMISNVYGAFNLWYYTDE